MREMWKVCVVGDPEVGKSTLVASFVTGEPLVRPSARSKMYKKLVRIGGKEVDLLVWDVSSLDPKVDGIIKGSRAVYVVVDVTNEESLASLRAWVSKVRKLDPEAKVVIIANKMDRKFEAKFWEEELRPIAQELGVPYTFTSAIDPLDGGVERAFLLPFEDEEDKN